MSGGYPRPKTISTAVITRPADTLVYASGDLVASTTTAGSVTAANSALKFLNAIRNTGYRGRVRRVGLKTSQNLLANGTFRVHLFKADPFASAPAGGDNAALSFASIANYLGYAEIVLSATGAGGASGWATTEINWVGENTTTLWGVIEARAAYVPASGQTFSGEIEVDQY